MVGDGPVTLPEPPYYAVVFSSARTGVEAEEYDKTSEELVRLAAEQPGFLGVESARDAAGFGITVSYWTDPAAIDAWRRHAIHAIAQRAGQERWYERYEVRVARVERAYGGPS
jgi:heme-degrading monooxygenase HmoA